MLHHQIIDHHSVIPDIKLIQIFVNKIDIVSRSVDSILKEIDNILVTYTDNYHISKRRYFTTEDIELIRVIYNYPAKLKTEEEKYIGCFEYFINQC